MIHESILQLKEQDLSDCHRTDPKCKGDTRYDNSFNLNSAENQEALMVREIRCYIPEAINLCVKFEAFFFYLNLFARHCHS